MKFKRISKPSPLRRRRGGHKLVPLGYIDPLPILKKFLITSLNSTDKSNLLTFFNVHGKSSEQINLFDYDEYNKQWLIRFINYFSIKTEKEKSDYIQDFLLPRDLKVFFETDSMNFRCLYLGFSNYFKGAHSFFNHMDMNNYLSEIFDQWKSKRNNLK